MSLRTRLIPDRMLGRVTAVFRTLSTGASALGAFAGGSLAQAMGLSWPFFIGGAVAILLGPALFRWPSNSRVAAALPAGNPVSEEAA